MAEWRQADVFRLIEQYRELPLLWNPIDENYKNRNKKHDAWVKLDESFGVGRGECEKKMRKLIGQFTRERRRVTQTGEKKWIYFQPLLFLRDRNSPRSSEDAGIAQESQGETSNDQSSIQGNEDLYGETPGSFSTSTLASAGMKRQHDRSRQLVNNKKTRYEDTEAACAVTKGIINKESYPYQEIIGYVGEVEQPYSGLPTIKSHTLNKINNKESDSYDIYGANVAATLRSLDKISAAYAKFEINKILFNAEIGVYSNQSGSSSPSSSPAFTFSNRTQDVERSGQSISSTSVSPQHLPRLQQGEDHIQSQENMTSDNVKSFKHFLAFK